jgi:hypothetical protein
MEEIGESQTSRQVFCLMCHSKVEVFSSTWLYVQIEF